MEYRYIPILLCIFSSQKIIQKKVKKKNQKTQAVYSVKAYNNKICTQL